jgi:hypothetical protein
MTTETTKKRTITLTGRPPVRITEEAWPIVAKATGDSYGGGDYCRHEQALSQGECDRYAIRVRQHADGRAIVYAVLDAACSAWGAPAGGVDHREGKLLSAGSDLAAAIRRVGDEAELPEALIRECIADLPAEELE